MSEDTSGDLSALDAAGDRFENAWRRGQRPRIEDFLADVAQPGRAGLLRHLLRLELELRRGRGERPTPREYHARDLGLLDVLARLAADLIERKQGELTDQRLAAIVD